ncbi:MAG: hypothetical protein IPN17_09505 [Deltaproteobacteria bacterium]|nr:hypothetical protein [Deltaproteobacteria bacterium]
MVFGIYARLAKQAAVVILMDSYQYERATVASVVAFRAATPFQYRVLVLSRDPLGFAAHGHGDLRRLADAAVVDLTARRPRVLPGALAMLPAVRTLGGVRADDPALVSGGTTRRSGPITSCISPDFPAVAFLALGITLLLKRRYG